MQSENYQTPFDREKLELEEKKVIEILINLRSINEEDKEIYDLRDFHSFIAPDLDFSEYVEIKGLYFGINILRQDLGFEQNQKPGDFDILVIPYNDDNILFERSGVYEVKVVRPTRQNPQKNANSLGITQLKGLISDGFPFVGLIHVSMSEPLLDNEKSVIQFCTLPANDGKKIPDGKELEDFFVPLKADHFQWYSVDKQMKRLVSLDIPKYVNIVCLGLSKNQDGFTIQCCSTKLSDFQKGYFNPHCKAETIDKVKKHFETFPNQYFKRKIRK